MCCDAVFGPTWDAIKFWNKLGYQELRVDEKKRKSDISEAIFNVTAENKDMKMSTSTIH